MFNNYNKFLFSVTTLISSAFSKFFTLTIIHSTIFSQLRLILLLDSLATVFICIALIISLILLCQEAKFCRRQKISLKNYIKSIKATYQIREFCMLHSKNSFDNDNDFITKAVNWSLYTIEVLFNEEEAKFSWTIPARIEAQSRAKELFDAIREELNHFDNNYIFSDIFRHKRNKFIARATKVN